MLWFARRLQKSRPVVRRSDACQVRSFFSFDSRTPYRSRLPVPDPSTDVADEQSKSKSEWWVMDGEMHEIGEDLRPRERFKVCPNTTNRDRKRLREQFMRRTRLFVKEPELETWCRRYMELYREVRENWERLYWDEGYSKKLAEDHANYDSAEDDDEDFSPYRCGQFNAEQVKDQGLGSNRRNGNWGTVSQVQDKFVFDRERGTRGKGFARIPGEDTFNWHEAPEKQTPSKWKVFD